MNASSVELVHPRSPPTVLIALSPTDALRTDLARVGRFDTDSDADAHGGAFARWLRVATVVFRLAQLPPDERPSYARGAARLWPVIDSAFDGPEFEKLLDAAGGA